MHDATFSARVWLQAASAFVRRHERRFLAALLAGAIVLRLLLVACSPQPYGYVWDFYHEGVRFLYEHGRLPASTDCWQCYHPPLFYAISWPVYAAQRWLDGTRDDSLALRAIAAQSLIWAALTIYFGYRLLRLLRCRGASLLLATGILLTFPCLFIASFSAEADVLLTAIMSAATYYLTRFTVRARRATASDAVLLGVLAGLAAATKYSGLVALVAIVIVLAIHVATGPLRSRRLRDIAIVVGICVLIAGWKYADNARRYGTWLYANGEAAQGLSLAGPRFLDEYEFSTLRLKDALALFPPDAPTGRLTRFPVYHSVFTTLHALAWTDMSIFSVPSRHGDRSRPYPVKNVSRPLVGTVLVLGLVPDALASLGFLLSWTRRALRPLAIVCCTTALSYGWWFASQEQWALKTKYVLFLLLPYTVFAMVGLGWLARRSPALATAAGALVTMLIVVTHVYLFEFATAIL